MIYAKGDLTIGEQVKAAEYLRDTETEEFAKSNGGLVLKMVPKRKPSGENGESLLLHRRTSMRSIPA